jgi:hypothetical protein
MAMVAMDTKERMVRMRKRMLLELWLAWEGCFKRQLEAEHRMQLASMTEQGRQRKRLRKYPYWQVRQVVG